MLQITLPDELQARVQAHTRENGRDVADWIASALENQLKQEALEAERQREAKLLRQALESGEPIATDDKWWTDFIADCNAKALEAAQKESA